MDVDRRRDPMAVVFRELLQRLGHHRVPAALLRRRRQVADDALLRPVGDVEAEQLHRRRRIARGDARPQHRHRLGAAAAGDRHVLPADALASRSCFSTLSAPASPPHVHQCSTSTSAARAAQAVEVASAASGTSSSVRRIAFVSFLR